MAKYITSIRDLMIQANNISDIKTKAKESGPEACFQMGMIHLLGIKTPIDFKKASSFLENQSLADEPDACRLLGFIGECEGNYSAAFKNFAQAAGRNSKRPYMNKVFEERGNLQGLFKKLVLPNAVLNKEITAIINDYIKGGESKVDACVELATLCNDEITCLEAAQSLYDAGDLFSAKRWLNKGNIDNTNELYIAVTSKLSDIKKSLKLPDVLQVIDIKGTSLYDNSASSSSLDGIKDACDAASAACKKTWMAEVSKLIGKIGERLEQEEKERIKKEKEEEAARIKKQQEEERERLAQEKLLNKEARKAKLKRIGRKIDIVVAVCLIPLLLGSLFANMSVGQKISGVILFVIIPFFVLRWIIRKCISIFVK